MITSTYKNIFKRLPYFGLSKTVILCFILLNLFSLTLEGNFNKERQGHKSIRYSLNNLPYIFDDIMFMGRMNSGGLFMSPEFKHTEYVRTLGFGIEALTPVTERTFFHFGIHHTMRNFNHQIEDVLFRNSWIEVPLFMAYELPELKDFDFRFLLGGLVGARLNSSQNKEYSEEYLSNPDNVFYNSNQFNRFDMGMTFGLSMEHRNIYFRLRQYMGVGNVMKGFQGSFHSFNIEAGCFIFRNLRK